MKLVVGHARLFLLRTRHRLDTRSRPFLDLRYSNTMHFHVQNLLSIREWNTLLPFLRHFGYRILSFGVLGQSCDLIDRQFDL